MSCDKAGCACCAIIGRGCPTCHQEYATHADWCPMRTASRAYISRFMHDTADALAEHDEANVEPGATLRAKIGGSR